MKFSFISLLLLFSFIVSKANAGMLRYLKTQYYRSDYLLKSRSHYDFPACESHKVEEEDYYYLKCEQSVLTPQENLDEFFGDIDALELAATENAFLSDLQEHVSIQLSENRAHMVSLQQCLKGQESSEDCTKAKSNILEMLRRDLPRMRVLMAQMNFPGVIYSPTKPQRFRNQLHHQISNVIPKELLASEVEFLTAHTDQLEQSFIQDVLTEKEINGLDVCVEQNGEALRLKDVDQCERFEAPVHYRASLKFNQQNEAYANQYNDLIESNPMLSLLTVTGREPDNEVYQDVVNVLDKLIGDSADAIANVNKLKGRDRVGLLGYRQAVNSMLSKETGGASRISCDVAQKLADQNDNSEMMTDIYIGLGAVAGGGLCAFTGIGMFGCSIGVGITAEGVALAVAQRRHEQSQSAFFAGIGSFERTADNEFNRNLSLYLLPLAVASEGAMHAIKLIRRTPTNIVSASKNVEAPPLPVRKERRYNFEGRAEIDEINNELGLARKNYLLNTYNPANQHGLSRMDETYFSGLADILEYRMIQDFPDLADDVVKSRVAKQLDELVKSCKGDK